MTSERWTAIGHALLLATIIALAAPIVAHAYAATFSRYMGDDYCAGATFRREGLVGAQKYFYMTWGAVPTTIVLMAATDPPGPAYAGWWPALALVFWVGSLGWAIAPITRRIYPAAPRALALCISELLVFATLADAPSVMQSVYQRIPMFAYVCPIIGLGAYVGLCVRAAESDRPGSPGWLTASVVTAFVVGNFGPVYVAMQTTALAMALVAVWTFGSSSRRRRWWPVLAAGLLGSIAALAVVAVAPGNTARARFFPPRPGIGYVIRSSVLAALFMFARPVLRIFSPVVRALVPALLPEAQRWLNVALTMASSPVIPLMVVMTGAILGVLAPAPIAALVRFQKSLLVAIPICAFVLVTACMAVGAYGTSAPPPPRALIIPQFACECLLLVWGFVAALAGRSWLTPASMDVSKALLATVLIVFAVGAAESIASTARTLRLASSLRPWARVWDQGDRELREAARAGRVRATAPALPPLGGVGSISHDSTNWVNNCAAQYYRLESVMGR